MRTPAQVSGRYDFVTDVPIQGPTDEGIRAADCWWTQNVLPQPPSNGSTGGRGPGPACTDCNGPIPMWANNPLRWNGGPTEYGGNGGPNCWGEQIRHDGRSVAGFALDAASDPELTSLTSDQIVWVVDALTTLNQQITQATGTTCKTGIYSKTWQDMGPSKILSMDSIGCFQVWYNANSGGSLRTDGVLDQDTLSALQATAAAHPADFTTPYPAAPSGTVPSAAQSASGAVPSAPSAVPEPPPVTPIVPPSDKKPPPDEKKEGLSTGAKLGIAAGATVVAGGIVYALAMRSTPARKAPVATPAVMERRGRR